MEHLTCWFTLVVLGVLLCNLQVSAACSCLESHPQTHVCKSDFVFVGTVKLRHPKTGKSHSKYKLYINDLFKATLDTEKILSGKSVVLRTGSSDDICARNLNIGEKWVLGGSYRDGKIYTTLCDLAIPWSNVTKSQEEFFRKDYRGSCECTISAHVSSPGDKNTCSWNKQSEEIGICQEKYSYCDCSQDCNWNLSEEYKKCMKIDSRYGSSDNGPNEFINNVTNRLGNLDADTMKALPNLDGLQNLISNFSLNTLSDLTPTNESTKIVYTEAKFVEIHFKGSDNDNQAPEIGKTADNDVKQPIGGRLG